MHTEQNKYSVLQTELNSVTTSFKLHELFSHSDIKNAKTLYTYMPICMLTFFSKQLNLCSKPNIIQNEQDNNLLQFYSRPNTLLKYIQK